MSQPIRLPKDIVEEHTDAYHKTSSPEFYFTVNPRRDRDGHTIVYLVNSNGTYRRPTRRDEIQTLTAHTGTCVYVDFYYQLYCQKSTGNEAKDKERAIWAMSNEKDHYFKGLSSASAEALLKFSQYLLSRDDLTVSMIRAQFWHSFKTEIEGMEDMGAAGHR